MAEGLRFIERFLCGTGCGTVGLGYVVPTMVSTEPLTGSECGASIVGTGSADLHALRKGLYQPIRREDFMEQHTEPWTVYVVMGASVVEGKLIEKDENGNLIQFNSTLFGFNRPFYTDRSEAEAQAAHNARNAALEAAKAKLKKNFSNHRSTAH
jgi:hypothetical protein